MDNGRMTPEDYLDDNVTYGRRDRDAIPIAHVIEKLDEHLSRNDYAAAERHLCYWEAEATEARNLRALYTIVNEQIGLFRKLGRQEEAFDRAAYALKITEEAGLSGTAAEATAYINAATAYKAFGRVSDALPLYEAARKIYERDLENTDERLGGLYNNYALALAEVGEYDRAEALFYRAIGIMAQNRMMPEEAVSYLNLADLYEARDGIEAGDEKIQKCLNEAERLLDDPENTQDGNYAFVCEKCHPTFDYFGRFFYAEELRKRMRRIYERP